eukprot:CAMPEP_0171073042 /NCGR_PEP_ID=MMETSP0766_2-20121228/11251_1 /TAXON_ID=439317 /ORGANISM="Gambierdiscus australes, Strain CAWD 149" /LENGTH=144 /DNA_ID=CAMNT_0011529691 /DNA_START=22 /DNA_END=457 /DNA_ORIENTATION=-
MLQARSTPLVAAPSCRLLTRFPAAMEFRGLHNPDMMGWLVERVGILVQTGGAAEWAVLQTPKLEQGISKAGAFLLIQLGVVEPVHREGLPCVSRAEQCSHTHEDAVAEVGELKLGQRRSIAQISGAPESEEGPFEEGGQEVHPE